MSHVARCRSLQCSRRGAAAATVSTAVVESSGNDAHGTLSGASGTALPYYVASPWTPFGQALYFDGVDRNGNSQGVDCGSAIAQVAAGNAFAVEARVRRDAQDRTEVVVGRWGGTTATDNYMIYFDAADNVVHCAVTDSVPAVVTLAGSTPVLAGQTAVVAMTFDLITLRLYVNGVREATTVPAGGISGGGGTTKLWIGRNADAASGPYPFKGPVDEVRLSIGTARQTGASYSVDSAPFAPDGINTRLLYHLDGS